MEFKVFKTAVAQQFKRMEKHDLFRTTAEKDDMWATNSAASASAAPSATTSSAASRAALPAPSTSRSKEKHHVRKSIPPQTPL